LLVEITLAEDAEAGGTIRVLLEANEHVRARGAQSGAISTVGAPLEGAAFTIVKALPPPANGEPPPEDTGCSCHASASWRGEPAWISLAFAAFILARRRPRRGSRDV
jgi:MYXO-CTERM domain-containing protein